MINIVQQEQVGDAHSEAFMQELKETICDFLNKNYAHLMDDTDTDKEE